MSIKLVTVESVTEVSEVPDSDGRLFVWLEAELKGTDGPIAQAGRQEVFEEERGRRRLRNASDAVEQEAASRIYLNLSEKPGRMFDGKILLSIWIKKRSVLIQTWK